MKYAIASIAFIGAIFGALALGEIIADWFTTLVPDLILASVLMWGLIITVIVYSIKFIKEALNG